MSDYHAPLKEMQFVINEIAGLESINQLPGCEEATADLVEAVLEQAAVLANEVFSPLLKPGDEHGTSANDGVVTSPPGFAEAYKQFGENGWQGINQSDQYGGQALPDIVQTAVSEMWNASNISLALCPLLTSGAMDAIYTHATDELKQTYLPTMVTGEWTGTMNLTEPQAGTDLAAIRTRADRDGDRYRIKGQKIFITWGEHEMSENIIHLVLAKLPDAPEGVKGISLFLVPKYLVNEDGSRGERNDLRVVSVEEKLGIHASPTCVMSYGDNDGAIGYLVGQEHNGLACMFTMMNKARHEVGMQGVGLSERAYQRALAYAQERVQGNAFGHKDRVTIIHHPDVRRVLMQMRAISEASRALGYLTASMNDHAHHSASVEDRVRYQRRTELLIPIIKGWCTELSQEVTYLGVQVHGGMGFIEETGAAQHMRDARILTIYEGTTGIQALDLMGRKMLRDKGQGISELIAEMRDFHSQIDGASFTSISEQLEAGLVALEEATHWYFDHAAEDPNLGSAVGVNYLMLAGYVVCGWLMARSAIAAQKHIDNGSSDDFFENKIKTATFYVEHLLPRSQGLLTTVKAGSASTMSIDVDAF